jgi:methionyl-tRNA formyltransferase
LRLWRAVAVEGVANHMPGCVVVASRAGLDVATGDGVLRVQQLQRPGGKPLLAADFLNSQPMLGECFTMPVAD